MTTSSSSQKKKTQVVADLIPNNYEEQPGLIEGKTKVFKDKVAARVDDLDNLGKFVTLFQVKIARAFFKSYFFTKRVFFSSLSLSLSLSFS